MLGGAIGAGSAVVMAAGVYGVKAGLREIKAHRAQKIGNQKYGNIGNATPDQIEAFSRDMNSDLQAEILKKNPEGCLDFHYDRNPNNVPDVCFDGEYVYDQTPSGINPKTGAAEPLDGLTIAMGQKVDKGPYDIFISKSGATSWRNVYLTSRHEAFHGYYFTQHPRWSIAKHHRMIWNNFEKYYYEN